MYLWCIVNWTHFFSSKKEGATLSTHSSSKCPASARHWCVSWKAGVPHQLSVGRHWLAVHDECQRFVSGLNFQQLHICLSICCIQLPLLETEYTLYRLLTKIQKCVNWEYMFLTMDLGTNCWETASRGRIAISLLLEKRLVRSFSSEPRCVPWGIGSGGSATFLPLLELPHNTARQITFVITMSNVQTL